MVKHIERIELALLYFIDKNIPLVVQIDADCGQDVAVSKNRTQFKHVGLVVEYLSLELGP